MLHFCPSDLLYTKGSLKKNGVDDIFGNVQLARLLKMHLKKNIISGKERLKKAVFNVYLF